MMMKFLLMSMRFLSNYLTNLLKNSGEFVLKNHWIVIYGRPSNINIIYLFNPQNVLTVIGILDIAIEIAKDPKQKWEDIKEAAKTVVKMYHDAAKYVGLVRVTKWRLFRKNFNIIFLFSFRKKLTVSFHLHIKINFRQLPKRWIFKLIPIAELIIVKKHDNYDNISL